MIVSVNIITLWRDTLYATLDTLYRQTFSEKFEVNLILQWVIKRDQLVYNHDTYDLNIYEYPQGRWFWYYRNEAIKHSQGDILVWIDDDERTNDTAWLSTITNPIIQWRYDVVTAGTSIELGKWYRTDCISYLWYPWWSVLWFDKLWTVFPDGTTQHLCSGNFAFHKRILQKISWFDATLKHGAEDVAFANKLHHKGISIYREKNATITHIHRSWLKNFWNRHVVRWKSVYEYMQLWLVTASQKKDKIRSLKYILFDRFFSPYVFGIWILLALQYSATAWGYCKRRYGR